MGVNRMDLNPEQESVLLQYTDNLDIVKTIPHAEYVEMSVKKLKVFLKRYNVIWLHDDPGNMYLIPKNNLEAV